MRRIATVLAAFVAVGVAALGGAIPASAAPANTYSDYCLQHDYDSIYGTSPQPSKTLWCQAQTLLQNWGYYSGPIDGVPGTNTWKGMQNIAASQGGYRGPIDGAPGPNTYNALKRMTVNWGTTALPDGPYNPVYNGSMSTRDWWAWGDAIYPRG